MWNGSTQGQESGSCGRQVDGREERPQPVPLDPGPVGKLEAVGVTVAFDVQHRRPTRQGDVAGKLLEQEH